MPEKYKETKKNDLEELRNKLSNLNQRVKSYSDSQKGTCPVTKSTNKEITIEEIRNVNLEDMRNKLHVINEYLKRKLKPKTVQAPSKEVVHEVSEEPIEQVSSEDIAAETVHEEKVSLSLPQKFDTPDTNLNERTGIGLYLGSSSLVAAREVEGKRVFVKNERNAFLSVRNEKTSVDLLNQLKIKYATLGDNMYVLGSLALKLASIFNREVQRSMNEGILNPGESESIPIIKLLIQHILWEPRKKGEICCFSVPAAPVDKNFDIIYHRGVFESILRSLGFEVIVIDEGFAVVLAELEYKDFTGIGVSCSGGMVNVCASYKAVPAFSFSIARGGDWIDKSASGVLGVPLSKVTTLKEAGMSIKYPKTREEEAIAIYYRNYIRYFLECMSQIFTKSNQTPQFNELVDIIFTGGASMVGDFLLVVKEELQSIRLGLSIGEIKRADEPLTSVTRGCLFNAISSDTQNL